ncbi:fungal-specific transcription factor domain-containing protein [Lipomyces tetrasporus]
MGSEDEDEDGSCRACDSCRLKKIKCDKKEPCGSCSSRRLRCLRTMPDARKRKRRNSGSMDDNVRGRLDQMQAQLDTIMSLLTTTRATATSYNLPLPGSESISLTSQTSTPATSLSPTAYPELISGLPSTDTANSPNVLAIQQQRIQNAQSQSSTSRGKFASIELLNSLVTNIKGQLQYLGKSSLLSMSIEAQMLTTALHDDGRDKTDKENAKENGISSVTDSDDEADYGKNSTIETDTVSQQEPIEPEYYHARDAKGNIEETQEKQSDFVEPSCPGMKALLNATLDYVASNFLPVDWVEELDIKDHTPVLPSRKRGQEIIDYYIDYILPVQQLCSFRFARMIRDETYQPDTPNRLQKIACISYMMTMVLLWPEYELHEGDIILREKMFKNIWLILKEPSVFITANFINAQTLLFAAAAAETLMHPGLCWMLISQCCRLAQTLGLHRRSALYFERGLSQIEIEERRCLFWHCYAFEKTLCLTFGRTSSMPMYDCDVERKLYSEELDSQGTKPTDSRDEEAEVKKRRRFGTGRCDATVRLVELYDLVYVRLYSAQAQQQSASDKRRAVRELDAMLRKVWADVQPWIIESWPSAGWLYMPIIAEAEFMYYVCMTMIHRVSKGIPDDDDGGNTGLIDTPEGWQQSTDIALASARRAILVIHEVLTSSDRRLYGDCIATWSLIFQPFAPFFELFSSVIKTGCREDLRLMRVVAGILKGIQRRPECVRKLNNVADLFTRLATMVVLNCATRPKTLGDGTQKNSVQAPASTAAYPAVDTPLTMPTPSNGQLVGDVVNEGLTTVMAVPSFPMGSTLPRRLKSVSDHVHIQPSDASSAGLTQYHNVNSSQSAPPNTSDLEMETFVLGGTVTQDASLSKWLWSETDGNPLYPPNFDWATFDIDSATNVDITSSQLDQQSALFRDSNLMPRF